MAVARRIFLRSGLLGAAGLAAPGKALALTGTDAPHSRLFDVITTVDLAQANGADKLWLPLVQAASPHQRRLGLRWESDAQVRLHRDARTGAQLLYARWASAPNAQRPRKLTLTERVAIWEGGQGQPTPISAAERRLYTETSDALATGGIVRETARRIVGDRTEPEAQLRAIYDWVIANTARDPATKGCGKGDITKMLLACYRSGKPIGGKCADINTLLVGLCRSAGLPARDVYGLRLAPSRHFKSLGRAGGDVTTAQHCRSEVWLDRKGWVPVDPADVRKVVLEENLPVDSPQVAALTEQLYGGREANWCGYNSATGIALPGAPREAEFHFLMYPCAMGDDGTANCLDAANFAYRITAAEVLV